MLAKLIELLIHAKAGVVSGVFLLGATGALISVSASNGVTTVTITEASPSPTTAVAPVTAPLVEAPASPKAAESKKVSTDSTACAAEAQAISFQVKRVNTAFSGFHTDLEKLRKDHSKDALETSDKVLKEIRQSAVKAIHATRTCKDDDEDEDADEADKTSASNDDEDKDEDKDEDEDSNDDHKTTSGLTFTGTAASIAQQAIDAMQVAFDSAKNASATTRKTEATKHPEGTKRPEANHQAKPTEAQHRD